MNEELVTTNKTLDAGDSGVAQVVKTSATITLPAAGATTSGTTMTIVNGGEGATDGAVTVTVSPNAADKIVGNGFTAADDKDIINTLGRGGIDYVTLTCVNEATTDSAWVITAINGTWTRQA
jgi:aspartokinase